MKIKIVVLLAASMLAMGGLSAAKEKGTAVTFPEWGVIYMPDDLYMQEGNQPMLTAEAYQQDAVKMLEQIYPLTYQTYQLIQKDGAAFQYGYMVRCSASLWDIEAAVQQKNKENSYLRDIGSRPDMQELMRQANEQLKERLPQGFRMTHAIEAKKVKGKTFYEGTWERTMLVNGKAFTETIQGMAYPHGNKVEIVLLFVNMADQKQPLLHTMVQLLETAEKMPKK